MFKPEHSIDLVRYIYTHEVSPIVGSLLGVAIVGITEEDLRQPKITSVSWDPTVLLMIQKKTERELDDVGRRDYCVLQDCVQAGYALR